MACFIVESMSAGTDAVSLFLQLSALGVKSAVIAVVSIAVLTVLALARVARSKKLCVMSR